MGVDKWVVCHVSLFIYFYQTGEAFGAPTSLFIRHQQYGYSTCQVTSDVA
jgi:hypothetical protein